MRIEESDLKIILNARRSFEANINTSVPFFINLIKILVDGESVGIEYFNNSLISNYQSSVVLERT